LNDCIVLVIIPQPFSQLSSQQNDFALEDLPPGHPIITRESLEEIGEYAFSTLRGLVVLGGQAKIDENLLQDAAAAMNDGGQQSPFQQILAIIKVSWRGWLGRMYGVR
jgi:symplekin